MATSHAMRDIVTTPASAHTPLHCSPNISQETFELENVTESGQRTPTEGAQSALPRADGGKDAWLVLFSCFILEALVWGFPFAFGVFNDYYAQDPLFAGNPASITAIGTTSTGIMYFAAPVVYATLRKHPFLRKPFVVIGFIVLLISLIAASFANTVTELIATQGVLYAIGGCIHYFPAFLYLDEWFFSRKGVAYGVVWAGAGTAGGVLPLTLRWMLGRWGFRTTLRAWAVICVILTSPPMFFLKGRLPVQHASRGRQKLEIGFFRLPAFWILGAGVTIQGLGHFLPTYYMPLFARSVGLPSISGTIAISLANGSNVVGALGAGWLVDRYHVTTAINVCCIGTVIAVFLFWSFAVYQPVLYIFAILYGLFSGGFASTWTGASGPLRQTYPGTETGMIIALFAAAKGLGAVISGPLSGALLESAKWKAGYGWIDGYGSLIIFSGVTAAATGSGWCCKKFGLV